ncbi:MULTISPECIES: hypothetical protein [unclassified Microbacterium]
MVTTERYTVLSSRGEAGLRTNDETEANRYATNIGGTVRDNHDTET